jgi:inner membrane protein
MPNFETHALIGGTVSALAYMLIKKSRDEEISMLAVTGMFLGGAAVSVLPDVIDSPDGPRHRSLGHSVLGAGCLGLLINDINNKDVISQDAKDIFTSLTLAYTSHLVLDAMTPAGLPLISNNI